MQNSNSNSKPSSVVRELLLEQLPLIVVVFVAGLAAAYLQHGFLPSGDYPYPLAAVRVPVWHIVWMGFWTGYTMALVGEASGIFALPYQMSVLQFVNPSVTPTTQLLSFLNPLGALAGFRRNRQWNPELALWICVGGLIGGLVGPFVRLYVLSETKSFTFVVGMALMLVGFHLCWAAAAGFGKNKRQGLAAKFAEEAASRRAAGLPPTGIPNDVAIETLDRRGHLIVIGFWGHIWSINVYFLLVLGVLVGVISSALGVGGGFMLVPLLVVVYGLPMYVLVAVTIPYVIVLSAVALFTYRVIMPTVVGTLIEPEWAWGLFAAAGGIFGAWVAAKTQRFIPEHLLKIMLGSVTSVAGILYVVNYFYELPFRV